jgi:hypothetical protein
MKPDSSGGREMREMAGGYFEPRTVAMLETVFNDTASLLKLDIDDKFRRTELARCILRLATEGECDPERLREEALLLVNRASTWRSQGKAAPITRVS